MNIFVLDKNPSIAAKYHCDKHVVKMILETAQILCTTVRYILIDKYNLKSLEDTIPYKSTHFNHPCTKWARESVSNFNWLVNLFKALHNEWKYRYNHISNHKSFDKLKNKLDLWQICIKSLIKKVNFTPFAQAMPDIYKNKNPVIAYRNYYLNDKKDLLKYTLRQKPEWIK